MMAIMERSGEEVPKEFLETGRTGRRNAMPDILQPAGASLTTADLPLRLQRVTIVTPGKLFQPISTLVIKCFVFMLHKKLKR